MTWWEPGNSLLLLFQEIKADSSSHSRSVVDYSWFPIDFLEDLKHLYDELFQFVSFENKYSMNKSSVQARSCQLWLLSIPTVYAVTMGRGPKSQKSRSNLFGRKVHITAVCIKFVFQLRFPIQPAGESCFTQRFRLDYNPVFPCAYMFFFNYIIWRAISEVRSRREWSQTEDGKEEAGKDDWFLRLGTLRFKAPTRGKKSKY